MVDLVAAFGRRTEMDDSKLPGTEDGQEGMRSGAAGVISSDLALVETRVAGTGSHAR